MSGKDISNLQDSFVKQQEKLTALKQLVRKAGDAHDKTNLSAQEKVKNIAQRLTHLKSKARSRQDKEAKATTAMTAPVDTTELQQSTEAAALPEPEPDINTASSSSSSNSSGTTSSDKIKLMRAQMEQNKARMQQRASSKQHLEQLVTQLKEKFDSTQQSLEDTFELGRSMNDISSISAYAASAGERYKSATELSAAQPFSLERERIKFLENRCRLLEKQLDKERQNDVSGIENELNAKRLKELENKVVELEAALTEARLNAHDSEQLQQKILQNELDNERLRAENSIQQRKLDELHLKLEKLEAELLTQQTEVQQLQTALTASAAQCEKLQQQLTLDDNSAQTQDEQIMVTHEMAKQIQQLQEELQKLRSENAEYAQKVAELQLSNSNNSNCDENVAEQMLKLQATIEAQRADLTQRTEALRKSEEELMEKTIELNVLNANFKVLEEKLQASLKSKPLFSDAAATAAAGTDASQQGKQNAELCMEIEQLKQKLDEANKAMIKLKLKCKQAEKQNEKLKKSSDLHAELSRLQQLNEQLQQQITELEDEKGQWQLAQMQKDDSNAGNNDETIRLLQTQNYELQQKLQTQSSAEQTQRVKCEMSEIQLEEQLQQQTLNNQALAAELQQKQTELTQLQHQLDELSTQKQALDKKLEHYLSENIELLDKLEKLSKSSSSAESIEIVERLTQQERAELDEFQQQQHHDTAATHVSELTQTELCPELNDSLTKLREESSELVNKIELFTNERREVLEKMEALTSENQDLLRKIEDLTEQRDMLETSALLTEQEKSKLESKLQEVSKEKQLLVTQVNDSLAQKSQLSQELTSMQQTSELVAALDKTESVTLFDKCEKSLCKLNLELEAYRKANNKDSKFNVSKKLAKEAKNAHTQLSELLLKVKEASSAVETVTVVETVVAVTAPNGKALAEYEQLTAQNRELRANVEQLQKQLQLLRENMELDDVLPVLPVESAEADLNIELQSAMEDLRTKLLESSTANAEKTEQIKQLQANVDNLSEQLLLSNNNNMRLQAELNELRQISDNFDKLHNDTEMKYESQVEQLTYAKKMLEAKCETYLAENEILQTLIAEQKQQLIETLKENEHEMNMKLLELQQRDSELQQLNEELKSLKATLGQMSQNAAAELQNECERLREALKINKTLVTEQVHELSNKQDTIDALNQQLIDLYGTMEDNANKIVQQNDEMQELQQKLAANNAELQRLREDNEQQKTVVDKLLMELHSHRANAQQLPQLEEQLRSYETTNLQLNDLVKDLQQRQKEQMEKLKKYAANLKKRTVQCQELETKVEQLEKGALEIMQSKENNNSENEQLQQQNLLLKEQLQQWREECEQKSMQAQRQSEELQQLQGTTHEQQQQLLALQTELSTAQQKLAEAQTDFKSISLKFEKSKVIIKERNNQLQRLQTQVSELQQRQQQPVLETIVPSNIQTLATTLAVSQLEEQHQQLKLDFEQLSHKYASEKSAFEQTIARLETLHDGIQAKLQEDMSYIETLELENANFKEKICKLEEAVGNFEERRISVERRATLLDAQMQSSASAHEMAEDELITRLNILSEHDNNMTQRLQSTQLEKNELQQQLNQLQLQHAELSNKYAQLQRQQEEQKHELNAQLQTEQQTLQTQLSALQLELQRQRTNYDNKFAVKATELDELECELSDHIEKVHVEKRELLEQLEKSQDELNKLKDELVRTQEALYAVEQQKLELEREANWLRLQQQDSQQDQFELQELRMQNMQDKTELDNLRQQINTLASNHELELQPLRAQLSELENMRLQTLQQQNENDNLRFQLESVTSNHEAELQTLRDQIAELDNMRMRVGQNQTDDQAFIESENKRLTDLLAEKQQLLDYYQRQQQQQVGSEEHDVLTLLEIKRELEQKLSESQQELQQLRTSRANNDNVPPANILFAAEAMAPTPFDDIIQARNVSSLEGAAHSQQQQQQQQQQSLLVVEQPTIEDLQRNVSDLEKHAQDLENKLLLSKQRDGEHEQQLHELQQQLLIAETRSNELEQNLSRLQAELQASQASLAQAQAELQQREQTCENLSRALENEKHFATIAHKLDSQIIPTATPPADVVDIGITDKPVPSLDMFFGAATDAAPLFALPEVSDVPVEEPAIVPEKSYICHPSDEQRAAAIAELNLDDASWGDDVWSTTAAEETVIEKTATRPLLISREQQLQIQLQEEIERAERVEQQRQDLQLKVTKLMKKLKEYKTKLEEQQANNADRARKSSSVESTAAGAFFDDLNAAIEDELKAQIAKLETNVVNLESERKKLLERIDVLTAGNERLTEMKERQDSDLKNYQDRVRELQKELSKLNEWSAEQTSSAQPVSEPVTASDNELQQKLAQLSAELQDLHAEQHELQLQLEEERANVARAEQTIKQLQQQLASAESAANTQYNDLKLQHQNLQQNYDSLRQSSEISMQQLQQQLAQAQAELHPASVSSNTSDELKLQTISQENSQLRTQRNEFESQIANLQAEIAKLQEQLRNSNSSSSSNIINQLEDVTAQLQEKESEILHLKQRIEDLMREDQTEKLVLEILTKNQEIHLLKMQVKNLEEDRLELQTNLTLQITKEMQETQAKQTNAQNVTELQNLQTQIDALQQEKTSMELELQELNNHVLKTLDVEDKLKAAALELDTKNIEIIELRKTLQTLQTQRSDEANNASTASEQRVDFIALNAQWEAIVEQKCGEIATLWRNHLAQREQQFKASEAHLLEQIENLTNELQSKTKSMAGKQQQQQHISAAASTGGESTPVTESSASDSANSSAETSPVRSHVISNAEDDAAILEKMQAALESQEMEIVTLKEQLAIRSAEYARLAAQYDPFKLQTTLSHSGMSTPMLNQTPTAAAASSTITAAADNSLVPKSKLDLALYMLHQRDMRCEEMTVELLSLLEERDTLQLKLSNTLRQVETMKTGAVEPATTPSDAATVGASTIGAANEELAGTTPNIATDELTQKLSQLQTVSHSKDKVIKEEREQRIRQMEQFQQDMANMPTAAASELFGADLSQAGQSPSTALLNWLWGNNKPTNAADSASD